MTTKPDVIVYGTDWCGLTKALRNYLDMIGLRFEYQNVEQNPQAETAVREMNGGKLKFPMVVVGEKTMKNPSLEELNKALNAYDLLNFAP